MLHEMIRNEKLELCFTLSLQIGPFCITDQQVVYSRFSGGRDVAIAAHTILEPGCFLRGSVTISSLLRPVVFEAKRQF